MNSNYVIEPTDVVHGKEWKSHKYIKKVMNKGKWVYYYTKNRAKGNKVTNKNGKTQYSPNIKTDWGTASFIKGASSTRDITYLSEPINGFDLSDEGINKYVNTRIMNMKFADKQAVTNKSPYPYDNDGNWTDKQYSPAQSSKAASSRHYTPNIKKGYGYYDEKYSKKVGKKAYEVSKYYKNKKKK